MNAQTKRWLLWGSLLSLLLLALAWSFRPQPVPVDLVAAGRGPLLVTVEDEGETRVHDIYRVSAPVAGELRRIDLWAGDPVTAGETVLARIEPLGAALLDTRSETQARADLSAAQAAETLARANIEQAQAELEFAEREHARALELAAEGTISRRDRDAAERTLRTARATLATRFAALDVSRYELARARATLMTPAEGDAPAADCACVSVRSPVSGQVLQVLHRSEGTVAAGEPLLEVGDPRELEVVVDLLTTDAVRVAPGQRVIIERWGGDGPLAGQVRRVEPFGFTKISALGVEEQRVNVVIDLTSPPETWARLAHGYQLDARIVLSESEDVLTVPLLALFRAGDHWAVFTVEDRHARLQQVELGRRSDVAAEVVAGLAEGDQVVLHASDLVADGVRVTGR